MFFTIEEEKLEEEIVEKKSKFIGTLFYITSEEQAQEIIKKVKKQYYDARHNCFAYRVMTENGVVERFSDDGEPSGTAGKPILNLIEVSNLNNIVIFVIRYFGGTLLGTGRLLRTYAASAKKVIDESKLVEVEECNKVTLECSYDIYDEVSYYLKNMHFTIIKINFNDNIIIEFFEPLDFKENLEERFYPKVKVLNKEKTSRIKE